MCYFIVCVEFYLLKRFIGFLLLFISALLLLCAYAESVAKALLAPINHNECSLFAAILVFGIILVNFTYNNTTITAYIVASAY